MPTPEDPSLALFERASAARAQILKVQQLASPGASRASAALVLTFDIGQVLVWADPARQRVVAEHIESAGDAPPGLVSADEDEPWWRVLGAVLSRASAAPGSSGIRLQFRPDSDHPRRIDLTDEGGCVRVQLTT